ncbi:MAG: kinA 2 [Gemmataceae bacterium]|nr:kinA 2 [Gemmataceae bacterium]
MSLRTYPAQLLVVTAASSCLLLASTAVVAVHLNLERARTAEVLRENIGSRRAAAVLEETLIDLLALESRGVDDVTPLHERVAAHLAEIERFADKQAERDLARRVALSFSSYRQLWENRTATPDAAKRATDHLRGDTLPACTQLRDFNTGEVSESEREHELALRWLAWGFAAVGVLGSVAGLVLGYGLARSLRRAVDSFLVRVQGASDLLGQELATVTVERVGPEDRDGVEDLVRRVGEVVRTLQQREREVRRAERLAAVGQLAAGVAHEIRNPLTSVQLLVQTARKDPTAGALDGNDLALIDAELGRIERSLKAFLDYARPPKAERVSCDVAAVVKDALNLIRARAYQQRVGIRFDAPPVPIVLLADPEQLRQVVVNLLLNALDAMPAGGTLEVVLLTDGDVVELAVTDTGPGIPAGILPRLFVPFVTGKETGLGLGLVVSKRIVEDHGGTIAGVNRPEGGARFVVRLPTE